MATEHQLWMAHKYSMQIGDASSMMMKRLLKSCTMSHKDPSMVPMLTELGAPMDTKCVRHLCMWAVLYGSLWCCLWQF
jgi:hypothetical protein